MRDRGLEVMTSRGEIYRVPERGETEAPSLIRCHAVRAIIKSMKIDLQCEIPIFAGMSRGTEPRLTRFFPLM